MTVPIVAQSAKKTSARVRIWRAMRMLRTFDLPQLITVAECGHYNAKRYAQALAREGILRVVGNANGGKGRFVSWQLVHDLGPRAPRLGADGKVSV